MSLFSPLSPADTARLAALRRMRAVALGLLVLSAALFCVSFALQDRSPWMAYLRAASEGALVGGLADWFAVTALFRHPMGLPIPHTALIERKKDQMGESLSEFIGENFLDPQLVASKISAWGFSRRAGAWLADRDHAETLIERLSPAVRGGLNALDDDDVRDLIADLANRHMVQPAWAPTVGSLLEKVVASQHHAAVVDVVVTRAGEYLKTHPQVIDRVVGERAPSWVPAVVNVLVSDKIHSELVGFVEAVRTTPDHEVRRALDEYLRGLGRDLQKDPAVIEAFETFKKNAISDPLVQELAANGWRTVKAFLIEAAENPESDLRKAATDAVVTLGERLRTDAALAETVERYVAHSAAYLVGTYRAEITSIVSETVAAWDAKEASGKIELLVGRDLQFIRINGTVVGALAGLAIFTAAHAMFGS